MTQAMRNLPPHNVQIPGWMWLRYQGLSGLTNPATFIRDLLAQDLADTEYMTHVENAAAQAGPQVVREPVEPVDLNGSPTPFKDRGRAIVCARWTTCDWPDCGMGIDVGDTAVIRMNAQGRKDMYHKRHFQYEPPKPDDDGLILDR